MDDKIYVPMTQEEYLKYIKAKEDKDIELKKLEWNDDNVIAYICEKFVNQYNQSYDYIYMTHSSGNKGIEIKVIYNLKD